LPPFTICNGFLEIGASDTRHSTETTRPAKYPQSRSCRN
jgi:hypothetical protein